MGSLAAIFNSDRREVDETMLSRMSAGSVRVDLGSISYRDANFGGVYNYAHSSRPNQHRHVSNAVTVFLSGTLYFRDELVSAIQIEDPDFQSPNQAEIASRAFELWGTEALHRIEGDFTLIIHDVQKNELIAARDQLGVKPLFYSQAGSQFLFASEQRQLFSAGVSNKPSADGIADYLSTNQMLSARPTTYYEAISQVEPGHYLHIRGNVAQAYQYWDLDPKRNLLGLSLEEMTHDVRALMLEAVAERIPENPPYGCALSGGFDSSSVAGMYRQILDDQKIDRHLDTFSFELRDVAADEPEIIDSVAARVNSKHRHIYVNEVNAFEVLPDMIAAMEQPTYDMGLLYLWRKKEVAAENEVYTMLSGLGGDEIFMGRFYYFADLFREGRWVQLAREMKALYPVDPSNGKPTSLTFLARAYLLSPLVPDSVKRGLSRMRGGSLVPSWIHPGFAATTDLETRLLRGSKKLFDDAYRQETYETFRYNLLGLTLPIHQSLGSANNVDTRFPLMDKRLVEYMFAAPRDTKIQLGKSRILQREAMRGVLPDSVTKEHLKKNPNPVLWQQQHNNLLKEMQKLFQNPDLASYQYVDKAEFAKVYELLQKGQPSMVNGYLLWCLLNLETWLESL